jgi:hypothetical protein
MRHREKIVILTLDKFIISHAGRAFNPLETDRCLQFLLSSSCTGYKRREQHEFYAKMNDQRLTSVIYNNGVKRSKFFCAKEGVKRLNLSISCTIIFFMLK